MFPASATAVEAQQDVGAATVDEIVGVIVGGDPAKDVKGVAEGTEEDPRGAMEIRRWSTVDRERPRRSLTKRWRTTGAQLARLSLPPRLLHLQHLSRPLLLMMISI